MVSDVNLHSYTAAYCLRRELCMTTPGAVWYAFNGTWPTLLYVTGIQCLMAGRARIVGSHHDRFSKRECDVLVLYLYFYCTCSQRESALYLYCTCTRTVLATAGSSLWLAHPYRRVPLSSINREEMVSEWNCHGTIPRRTATQRGSSSPWSASPPPPLPLTFALPDPAPHSFFSSFLFFITDNKCRC